MLHEFLDVFVIIYIDNILIYLSMLSKHKKYIRIILEHLRDIRLQYDIKKCEFHAIKVIYLDLIVFQEEIKMDSTKVKVITSWESPQNMHNI